jgi:hypothetical protein
MPCGRAARNHIARDPLTPGNRRESDMERRFAEDDGRRARRIPRRSRCGAQAVVVDAGDRRPLALGVVAAVWCALALILHLH